MSPVNYDDRVFRAVANSTSGEANGKTVFHYRQNGEVVWATYEGGRVRFGTLVGVADDQGTLELRYSHVNLDGVLRTGVCHSTPETLPDGRIRLLERWRWTSGDLSEGESIIEEIPPSLERHPPMAPEP